MAKGDTVSNDLVLLAVLAIGLLVLMVIFGFTFIFAAIFEKTTCEDIEGKFLNISSDKCVVSSTDGTVSESLAFNSTGKILTVVNTVLAFLIVIVLAILIKIILKIINVRKMGL